MKCIGINESFTMSMPLGVLSGLNADFDGDNLNIMYIPNKDFWESAIDCFSPRNAMMVSRNDGRFNNQVNLFKDILINSNGLRNCCRKAYSDEDIAEIKALKQKYHA